MCVCHEVLCGMYADGVPSLQYVMAHTEVGREQVLCPVCAVLSEVESCAKLCKHMCACDYLPFGHDVHTRTYVHACIDTGSCIAVL